MSGPTSLPSLSQVNQEGNVCWNPGVPRLDKTLLVKGRRVTNKTLLSCCEQNTDFYLPGSSDDNFRQQALKWLVHTDCSDISASATCAVLLLTIPCFCSAIELLNLRGAELWKSIENGVEMPRESGWDVFWVRLLSLELLQPHGETRQRQRWGFLAPYGAKIPLGILTTNKTHLQQLFCPRCTGWEGAELLFLFWETQITRRGSKYANVYLHFFF